MMSMNLESAPAFQAQTVVERARWAANIFSNYRRDDVLRIAQAVAELGVQTAREYADWAVEETGFGNPDHKEIKNIACSQGVFDFYRDEDFTSHKVNLEQGIVEIPRPAGVIFALTPSTNPVCSVFFKALLCILTRNAIVISPHPAARECCTDAARRIAETAENAGAPDGVVQVIAKPNLPVIESIMNSDRIDLILATGGSQMVRAAYSSGNPALGVGPGNCPAYVDKSADIEQAAKFIADSKSFDESILCTNESAAIVHQDISDALVVALQKAGCYFCNDKERERVEEIIFPEEKFDISCVGKSAGWLAERARIRVPENTRVLVVELDRIGDDYPLSTEKLCPVLGYYTVPNRDSAIKACQAMTRHVGSGHSAAIHCTDQEMILRFGAELNVLRTAVNAPCSMGASGFETHLSPTMTVGTGFYGRSSIDENVGPQHLLQWVRLAYNKNASYDLAEIKSLRLQQCEPRNPTAPIDYSFKPNAAPGSNGQAEFDSFTDGDLNLREVIHEIILEEIRSLRLVEQKTAN